ncbi:MAG: Gfo/Idh/MocA family oxidoreductase [Jiangellales bacterium]
MATLVIRHHCDNPRLWTALAGAGWVAAAGYTAVDDGPLLGGLPSTADPAPGDLALVVVDHAASSDEAESVVSEVLGLCQQLPVLLVGATVEVLPALADAAGVTPGSWTPRHETRLRPGPGVDPRRLDDLLVTDRLLVAEKVSGDVQVLVTANLGFRDYPVCTWNAAAGLGTVLLGGDPEVWQQRELLRLVRHLGLAAAHRSDAEDVGVAMVGYGAIGHEHALAADAVPGLSLAAVSDLNPARLDVARSVAADVTTYTDSDALLADESVDLVVVSTPPSSHADWAVRALQAGKHVVLEKPMALTAAECDEVLRMADDLDRLVVVYQNRRFDPDYLVMRRLVSEGAIGELFHFESFVGGYGHPCNYWHSDATVSGGAIFDWGSHFLDQVLDLMPGEISHVSAANHKRRWHDVTNADHSRVTVHFADGREAEFIHSDLAAASKPKWLALGTAGAIRGDWRTERVVGRTAIGTLAEDVLATADSPAAMSLHHADGSVTALAAPPAPAYAFHRELADHLLRGLPMTVQAAHSRAVVALMEAAESSAVAGSTPVRPA